MQNYEKYDYNANFFIKLVELSYKSINLSLNTKANKLGQKNEVYRNKFKFKIINLG